MNEEKIISQFRKGVLEMCVLRLSDGAAKYTGDLLQELKSARLLVVEGTIYPLLNRLKDEGYLEYYWEESTGGPPRKYYRCTDKGREYLTMLRQGWFEMVESVNAIIK
ncbi:Transcriptional regulator PadR-like family protein [anaerobic digester metagenome]